MVRIKGYRVLEEWEIDLMNDAKAFEAEILEFIEAQFSTGSCDDRWLSIARTDLQKGFMALGRAIAKPAPVPVCQHTLERVDVVHTDGGDVLAVKEPEDVPEPYLNGAENHESDIRDIPPATGAEIIEEMTKDEPEG